MWPKLPIICPEWPGRHFIQFWRSTTPLHQNDQPVETNRMALITKLNLISFRLRVFRLFLFHGLTWATWWTLKPKTTLVHFLAITSNSWLEIMFSKFLGVNAPWMAIANESRDRFWTDDVCSEDLSTLVKEDLWCLFP